MQGIGDDVLERVGCALAAAGEPVSGPLTSEIIAHGRSNITAVLRDARSTWVLRMPPARGRTPSAHDIAREYRIAAALAATDVPVARPVLLIEDERVIGCQFSISDFVHGAAIRTHADIEALAPPTREDLASVLMANLARLHRVDYSAAGLADFERPGSYGQRQFARWSRQWDVVGTAELAARAEQAIAAVARVLPAPSASTLVHGDYRVDNTIVTFPDHGVAIGAIVDWELATVGDPVADVATTLAYRHPALDLIHGGPSAWTSGLLPSAAELADSYTAAGGFALHSLEGHLALANLKIAVIAAGVAFRIAPTDPDAPPKRAQLAAASAAYFELAREAAAGATV